MFRLLMALCGEKRLTSSQAVSLVRTSQQQEQEKELKVKDQDYGVTSLESLEKSDLNTASLRTVQDSSSEDSPKFSQTLTRWGMMRRGVLSELTPLALPISETGFGSKQLYPTLTICGNYNRKGASKNSGDGLFTYIGGTPTISWLEWFMGFPVGWTNLAVDAVVTADWDTPPDDMFNIKGEKKRSNRIKGLGNAQVPAQAVLAWNTLSQLI